MAIASLTSAIPQARSQEMVYGFPRKLTVRNTSFEVATPEELAAKGFQYEYPAEDENAAIDYIEAMNVLHRATKSGFPKKAYYHVMKHAWVAGKGLEQWLDAHEEVHHLVRTGVQKPKCVFPMHNASRVIEILLPHYAGLRSLARYLVVHAKQHAHEGRYPEAADDLLMIAEVAEQTRKEPVLIGGLVNIAVRKMALRALTDLVLRYDVSEELLRQVGDRLERSQQALPELRDGLKAERWMARDFTRLLVQRPGLAVIGQHGGPPGKKLDPDGERVRTALLRIVMPDQTVADQFDRVYDRLETFASQPPLHVAKAMKDGADAEMLDDIPPWNVLAKMLLPALGAANRSYLECDARTRLTRAVVLLKAFKMSHGDWPDELVRVGGTLEPDLSDPFAGRPFRFTKEADGWVLYSVGPDLSNDGGNDRKDITVRYPLPRPEPFVAK